MLKRTIFLNIIRVKVAIAALPTLPIAVFVRTVSILNAGTELES